MNVLPTNTVPPGSWYDRCLSVCAHTRMRGFQVSLTCDAVFVYWFAFAGGVRGRSQGAFSVVTLLVPFTILRCSLKLRLYIHLPVSLSGYVRLESIQEALDLPSSTTNDDKLALYGLFKQAKEGDCNTSACGLCVLCVCDLFIHVYICDSHFHG